MALMGAAARSRSLRAVLVTSTCLLGVIAPQVAGKQQPPLPPPPLIPEVRPLPTTTREGDTIQINGRRQQAHWRWVGTAGGPPQQLWLPLEVLQNQLGVSSRPLGDGSLDLEWFGQALRVPTSGQQALKDEVAIDALPLLEAVGMRPEVLNRRLTLNLPRGDLQRVRSAHQGLTRRVVLDLAAPTPVRQEGQDLVLDINANQELRKRLSQLGLATRPSGAGLALRSSKPPARVFTLGTPHRVVIDLPAEGTAPGTKTGQTPIDPRLKALLGRGLRWEKLSRNGVRINAVRIEPRQGPLRLMPMVQPGGAAGLLTLPQLAQQNRAWVAINGGYFNRVRRLPLGALKLNGRWLSGPILNRGVAAWSGRELPRFGRLKLQEWVRGPDGRRLPVVVRNSGYVQRGISLYDSGWGSSYKALSGAETALLLKGGNVTQRFTSAQLDQGVALGRGDLLVVGRGGVQLPWLEGMEIVVTSRTSSPLGEAEQVVGGGPLLLQQGRIVLNGAAENFGATFLRQGAPRTVLGRDDSEVWLITLVGEAGPGPTLAESARLLLQLGLKDALNLDGGSSTGLVVGGSLRVTGRGVAGRVNNGVGLVP